MSTRPGLIIVICTVLLVHVAFLPATYHVGEVKFFIFTAGVLSLLSVVAADVFSGRLRLSEAFAGRMQKHVLSAVTAFVVLCAASVFWTSHPTAALFRTLEALLYAAWALMVAVALGSRRDVSRVLNAFLAAGALTAAVAFACCLFYPQHREQFFLPMGNANWLATCLLIPMMLCVEWVCRSLFGSRRRVGTAALLALAFVLMAAVMILSKSESAVTSLLLGVCALPVLMRLRRKWLTAGIVAGVLVLACAGDLALGRPGKIRSFARTKSVGIRLAMWRWGLELARRNPVTGIGAGGYFPNVGEVSARDMNRRPGYYADISVHAHNEPLEVLVELGMVGLLAFLWPLGALLWGVARLPSGARAGPEDALPLRLGAFAAGWLAVFLQSFLTVGMRFWSVPVVFWTGVGLLAASLRILSQPQNAGEAPAAKPLSRRKTNVGIVVLIAALLAGCYFILFRGFRASLAMKEALEPMGGARRIGLLERVSEESVFFVDRVRARSALGRFFRKLGRPTAAAEQFETVLKLAGDYHDTKYLLAETYLDRSQPDDAMPLIESHGRLRPADPRTANLLVRYLTGLPAAEAVSVLDSLIGKRPRCSKLHVAAGKIALRFEPPDAQAARRHFARALHVNPDDAHAAYLLGVEKLKQKHYRDARGLLARSLENGLRLAELHLNLSRLERMFGEEERAGELIREGVRLFPESRELRKKLEKPTETGG